MLLKKIKTQHVNPNKFVIIACKEKQKVWTQIKPLNFF
jgi:hypothetical protein